MKLTNIFKCAKPMIFITIVISLMMVFSGCNVRDILVGEGSREEQIDRLSQLKPDDIKPAITRIVDWGFVAAGSVAGLFFIFGGFQYMTALGNEEKSEKAKSTLFFALVGMIIILVAYGFIFFLLDKFATPDAIDKMK